MSKLPQIVLDVRSIAVFHHELPNGQRVFYVAGTCNSTWYAHTSRFAKESDARLFASRVRGAVRQGQPVTPALWEHAEAATPGTQPFPADLDVRINARMTEAALVPTPVDDTPEEVRASTANVLAALPLLLQRARAEAPAKGNCYRCGGTGIWARGSRSGPCFGCNGSGTHVNYRRAMAAMGDPATTLRADAAAKLRADANATPASDDFAAGLIDPATPESDEFVE